MSVVPVASEPSPADQEPVSEAVRLREAWLMASAELNAHRPAQPAAMYPETLAARIEWESFFRESQRLALVSEEAYSRYQAALS